MMSHLVRFEGSIYKTQYEFCKVHGLCPSTVRGQIKKGFTPEMCIDQYHRKNVFRKPQVQTHHLMAPLFKQSNKRSYEALRERVEYYLTEVTGYENISVTADKMIKMLIIKEATDSIKWPVKSKMIY
jgi:hypothetical protein